MRITILETGRPPASLRARFPDYPAMFEALLGDGIFSFETIAICDGAPPPKPEDVEAVLITGSSAGVYEDHPWIAPLEGFIRAAAKIRLPQIGICFGHQVIAQALGGQVAKSTKGWGVGRHAYALIDPPAWMGTGAPGYAIAASHQDQVIAAPPGARLLAASAHTPFAALYYEKAHALTFQGHPEMSAAFTAALVASRRGRISEALIADALLSLDAPLEGALVAGWIRRFLQWCDGQEICDSMARCASSRCPRLLRLSRHSIQTGRRNKPAGLRACPYHLEAFDRGRCGSGPGACAAAIC